MCVRTCVRVCVHACVRVYSLCLCVVEKLGNTVLYFQVKKWCFVIYRYFNLSRLLFPNKLRNCAWKPIVIEASKSAVSHNFYNLLMSQIKKSQLISQPFLLELVFVIQCGS